MAFTTVAAFLEEWKDESAGTERILRTLTDASLGARIGPQERTLGRMAWHVVQTVPEMMNRTGLGLPDVPEKPPAKAAAMADAYAASSAALVAALKSKWKDATLAQVDDMYGQKWNRALTLRCLISHQIHHRGQMTVLMRQAGLSVPGYYGPAREEWSKMGMPAPEV
jgi:uncharacterized damage-inducible protein DinB